MALSKRYQLIMRSLRRQHPDGVNGLRILDVGDYYPTLPVHLHDHGAAVHVLDFDCSEETARTYQERGIQFKPCDLNLIRENPIGLEGNFDIIIWLEVIEHLKCSPKYVFREFSRLLKRGGLLVIGTPNAGRLSSRVRQLMGRHPYMPSLEPFYFGAENFVGHRREYFIHEIDTILKWNGYGIVDRIFFNGSLSDHKKQGWLKSAPYLALTYFFKHMRWIYIALARNTGDGVYEPSSINLKRV